jgi:hypothetical protein
MEQFEARDVNLFAAHEVGSRRYFLEMRKLGLLGWLNRNTPRLAALIAEPTDEGYDLSHWNGVVNDQVGRQKGLRFSYIKLTEGTTGVDSMASVNWPEQKAVGFLRGGYHFLRQMTGNSQAGIDQANHFVDTILDLLGGDFGELPMAVDVEVQLNAIVIQAFVQRIFERLNYYPLIYTSPNAWNTLVSGNKAWATVCKLWVAHWYTSNPTVPPPWSTWTVHQYTDIANGPEYGCQAAELDLDRAKSSWLNNYVPEDEIVPLKRIAVKTWTAPLKSRPALESNNIGMLTKAQELPVLEENGEWYRIEAWIQKNKTRDV